MIAGTSRARIDVIATRRAAATGQVAEPLDVFDRLLLEGDATVTSLLETCTSEPIDTLVTQESGPAPAAALIDPVGQPWRPEQELARIAGDEPVIVRRVILRGARTQIPYVLGESLVMTDRLPVRVIEHIRAAGGSIGKALVEQAVENRRRITSIEHGRAGGVANQLVTTVDAPIVRRTYTIMVGGRIAIFVTETLVAGRLCAATHR